MRNVQKLTSSKLARIGAALVLMFTVLAVSTTADSATGSTIQTKGNTEVHLNVKILSSLRFVPGTIEVRSGEQLTLVHADATDDPHTLSIVEPGERPTTVDDVLNCGAPDTVCGTVFGTVGPQIVDQGKAQFINVSGRPGLDGHLDTLWLPAGTSIKVEVDAPAGTTLSYMCAIHAWMQGTIKVV